MQQFRRKRARPTGQKWLKLLTICDCTYAYGLEQGERPTTTHSFSIQPSGGKSR